MYARKMHFCMCIVRQLYAWPPWDSQAARKYSKPVNEIHMGEANNLTFSFMNRTDMLQQETNPEIKATCVQ
jgi:hypothetical protein